MTQRALPFPRRRPSRSERLEAENIAAARIVLRAGESVYGAGLVAWARRVLGHDESEVQHADDDFQT